MNSRKVLTARAFAFVVAAHLLILSSVMAADAGAEARCTFKGWGFRSALVEDGGDRVIYAVRMSGLKWRLSPYGYHAPAFVKCISCENELGGLLELSVAKFETGATMYPGVFKQARTPYPGSAVDRISRDSEMFGYPMLQVSGDDLTAIASRDQLKVGGFKGYAVLYDAKLVARGKLPTKNFGILILSLSDGCILLQTTLQSSTLFSLDSQVIIDDILSRLTIEKYDGDKAIPIYWTERIGGFLDWVDFQTDNWRRWWAKK